LCYKYFVTYYERHLPHWQPEGVAIFITWRLYGSFPGTVQAPKQAAGKAFVVMDRDLDRAATGPRWLLDDSVAQCVVDALLYGESQLHLYTLQAWVVMPNHVHILIDPQTTLPRITRSIKNYSAHQANAILGRTGEPFWQEESYDHWARSPAEFSKIIRYIEENPVKAGLVENAGEWRWSSAFGK
jgi:REP element-mobilizing transposase RayT